MNIIVFVIVGAMAGLIARIMNPKDQTSWPVYILGGIAGSVSAGLVWSLIAGTEIIATFNLGTLVAAIVGAVVVLTIYAVFAARRRSA